MRPSRLLAACCGIAFSTAAAYAADGFAVSVSYLSPPVSSMQWAYDACFNRGNLVRYDITNNAVASRDTLYKGWAQWPAINLAGTKIAFFRWGKSVRNGQVVNESDPNNYISVVNRSGGMVTNLVAVAAPLTQSAADRDPLIDWPAGDWVYYEKPTKTHQIWRVSINDPSRNELVVTYQKSPKGEDSGPIYFWRWTLSVDAKAALIWSAGYTWNSNIWHCFPPTNGDPLACAPTNGAAWAQIWACNGAVSPSGKYACHYIGGAHETIEILSWDLNPSSGYGTVKQVTLSIAGAEQLRFSANSDKWVQEQVGYDGHAAALCNGSNQWLINWKDGGTVVASGNPRGQTPAKCSDAGDFWINGGEQNAGKYEDANGNWIAVAPIDPINPSAAAAAPVSRAIARTAPHLLCGDRGLVVQWESGAGTLAADVRGRKITGVR
jgi:hypothetical protein